MGIVPWLVLVAMWIVGSGCGSKAKTSQPQYPVHGKVTSAGQPAVGAFVVLHPITQEQPPESPPRGIVEQDGSFGVGVLRKDDGAPAGEYAVTIIWPKDQEPGKETEDTPPDRLKNRYNNVQKPAWTIHVVSGDNTLEPFEIQ
jgi:hypothetical protein